MVRKSKLNLLAFILLTELFHKGFSSPTRTPEQVVIHMALAFVFCFSRSYCKWPINCEILVLHIKLKFLFIAIAGVCLGIFKGSHGSHRAAPKPMCLPTMTQAGHEHAIQCIRLVYAEVLRIAPQVA